MNIIEQRVNKRIKDLKEILESLKDDKKYGDIGYCDFDAVDEKMENVEYEIAVLNFVLTGKINENYMVTDSL